MGSASPVTAMYKGSSILNAILVMFPIPLVPKAFLGYRGGTISYNMLVVELNSIIQI